MRRMGAIALLMALLHAIGIALIWYERNQADITLEGNGLLSSGHIEVLANPDELGALQREGDEPYAVYRDLDGGGLVRAVDGPALDRIAYPIHEGRSFERDDAGVALVGASVPTMVEAGREYVDVDTGHYQVIGKLGRRADSLAAYSILIADRSLLAGGGADQDDRERLILDGPRIAERYAAAFPGAEYLQPDAGTNRRTAIDVVSPLLISLGRVVVVIGAVCAGILAALHTTKRAALARLLGQPRLVIHAIPIAHYALPAGAMGLASLAICLATPAIAGGAIGMAAGTFAIGLTATAVAALRLGGTT